MLSPLSGFYLPSSAGGETVRAFVPYPLPPRLELGPTDYDLMERANRALGRLDGVSSLLPDRDLFLYFYIRKEAVLSSQIEGTQSSLSDLLAYESDEATDAPLDDVQEVSNYVAALNYGLERLRDGFPLSLRLIKEIHGVLLREGRGAEKMPGEFRRSQVWIGGSRPGTAHFVPPPASHVMETMGALENFLHATDTPVLIRAALAHVQFETIHPFLDGNGRVGRLLITFLLCAHDVLEEPLLYLSLYFKSRRDEYYKRLDRVRTHGEWEQWLRFFLQGVYETSQQAVGTARDVLSVLAADRDRIKEAGRAAGSVLRVHEAMQRRPRLTVRTAVDRTGLSGPTVRKAFDLMERLGIVREETEGAYGRRYRYTRYLALLERGTEPL